MIRKYLICGKQPFLSSRNAEPPTITVVELLMPLQVFWETEGLIQKLEYSISAGEDPIIIQSLQARIYQKVARYAVIEKDRLMLMSQGQETSPHHDP